LLISVCRRWAIGSSEENKTSRAKWGLSLIVGIYLFGGTLQLIFLFEPEVPDYIPAYTFKILIASFFIIPLLIINRVFGRDKVYVYIKKYKPKNLSENIRQQLLAFSFCICGWLILFGPFFIN
jgi:hypothetical protein